MESPSSRTRRRPCFIEEDDGLASLAETQPEFSGNNNNNNLISRPLYYNTLSTRRTNSFKNLSLLSPRSVVTTRCEEPHQYFLDSCFLCKKRIGDNSDIFMYRGDTPFCSEECRQQQIEKDEAKDRKRNISSIKAMRKKEQRQQQSTSPNKSSEDYPLRPGTVAAA